MSVVLAGPLGEAHHFLTEKGAREGVALTLSGPEGNVTTFRSAKRLRPDCRVGSC
jgi:hypothetical protein